MKKITLSLLLVHFFFSKILFGTDLSLEIQRVAFKQSKKISKIVIKEGACDSLNGQLINTCNLTKKPISQQKYIHKKNRLLWNIFTNCEVTSARAKIIIPGQANKFIRN
ncbi:MAG: hypothetical protein ACJ0DH_05195 [bacterium]